MTDFINFGSYQNENTFSQIIRSFWDGFLNNKVCRHIWHIETSARRFFLNHKTTLNQLPQKPMLTSVTHQQFETLVSL